MRPPADRAATLRAYAVRLERYAVYFDVRARAERAAQALRQAEKSAERGSAAAQRRLLQARVECEAANAADVVARDAFHNEPGAHALFQRIEFEAELYEALEGFKARVASAERTRDHKPFTIEQCSPVFALLQDVVGAAAGRGRQ